MPSYKPAQYREIAARLNEISRELAPLYRASRADLVDALADRILGGGPTGAHLSLHLKSARDLARWAGADRVGASVEDAVRALASAWIGWRDLERAALGKPELRARYERARLARRAHENGRSITDQRAHDRAEAERFDAIRRAKSDRPWARTVIAARAANSGRVWTEFTSDDFSEMSV